ncbi:MAG: hypothetical protein NTY15_05135 [Planctomycetota bacterium]|nr:hypothetical protein [Planctomycetota bacterium]
MNHRVIPLQTEERSLTTNLPFSSPVSIVRISVVRISVALIGFWQVGASLAQSPNATTKPSAPAEATTYAAAHSSGRNWALDIANAQLNLDPNRLPDIGMARQRLDQAMSNLENFLATSPQHQSNWLAFLAWNDLQKELKEEKPDLDRITQIEKAFRQNYFGLEMSPFTGVRDALANYAYALKFGSDKTKAIESFNKLLTKLSEQLQLPNATTDFENAREVGQSVAYLVQGNQVSNLVQSVRGVFSRANARVLISSEFLGKRFSRPVNEANPVNEVILGTQLFGQSWLHGYVTPQLLDSSSNAAMRLNLNGSFSSQNIGYNRSVKLHTQGSGGVAASETIVLTDSGLVPLKDTSSDANLSSQINDIEARLRIVRKIASKQAAKQKPQADSIAEGRLEDRIRTQFHEKLTQQISEANERIKTPDLPVLTRLGLDRPSRTTWSSPQYLALLWKLQGQSQLASPISCPLVVEPSGVTVQLHHSIVTNLLDPVLAGRIIKNTDIDSISLQFGGTLGKGLAQQKDEKPWAITMAPFHPVEIELDDSLVKFRIRTSRLDSGDQVLKMGASIEAAYKIVVTDGAIQLERQEDVKIVLAEQRGARPATIRRLLKKIFDDVFKQELLDQPVRVTDRLPNELKELSLISISVDDGWIQAHLR